ncbi:MAG: hypothetical protein C0390_03735 [Syntrophus sp. (in: bacteria)]|nr:hypothetical protein [Syntrophus sp. (in: bacteria)]
MRRCRPSCRLKDAGGKNCRLVRGFLYKISLYQILTFNNRLCAEIDKNVENPLPCLFFYPTSSGDTVPFRPAAAGKEIVDFPGELPMITHSPVATMDMRYEL